MRINKSGFIDLQLCRECQDAAWQPERPLRLDAFVCLGSSDDHEVYGEQVCDGCLSVVQVTNRYIAEGIDSRVLSQIISQS